MTVILTDSLHSPAAGEPELKLTREVLASDAPIPLARSSGLSFRNEPIAASIADSRLQLRSSGQLNNFPAMVADRGNPENFSMTPESIGAALRSSLMLANVGVSVAMQVNIANDDYLVLVRRPNGMLMLPSGYVNSGQPRIVHRHAFEVSEGLREANEEVVRIHQSKDSAVPEVGLKSLLAPAHLKVMRELSLGSTAAVNTESAEIISRDLGKPFNPVPGEQVYQVKYRDQDPSIIRPSDDVSPLPGLNVRQAVSVDGNPVEFGKFYYLRETRSGQFVFPYRMTIGELSGCSLFHTETAPVKDGKPGDLAEMLDRKGLILARTSPAGGLLTGETFYFLDGALVPTGFAKESLRFSEVFATQPLRIEGSPVEIPMTTPKKGADGKIVTTVSFEEYIRSAEANLAV